MMSPTVTETTPRLEPVTPDPFISPPSASTWPAPTGSGPAPAPPGQFAFRM